MTINATVRAQIDAIQTAEQARDTILQCDDRDALIEHIRQHFNCWEADVSDEGNVWIANPQRGHWLDDDNLIQLAKSTYE